MNHIFYKKLPGFEYNLIHLYEHLVVRGLIDHIEAAGQNSFMAGYFEGRTYYESTMFYVKDDALLDIARNYLNQQHIFCKADIDKELSSMGAELAAIYTVADYDKLQQDLARVDAVPYRLLDSDGIIEYHPLVRVAQTVPPDAVIRPVSGYRQYDTVSVNISLPHPTLFEMAAFFRLDYLINDVAYRVLRLERGAYRGASLTEDTDYDGTLTLTGNYYLRKGTYDIDKIKHQIAARLRNFSPLQYPEPLQQIIDQPVSRGLQLDYREEIGLLISNSKIRASLSFDNIGSMWDKLQVGDINIFPDHRGCRDIYIGKRRWNR